MAVLSTIDEFLDLVRKSRLVDDERLDAHLSGLRTVGALPAQPEQLAATFVRDGLLTDFQAKQLLAGKYKNFLIGDKYKLLELLGAGGMGRVYLCEHVRLHRLVAVKVLPSDKINDPAAVERFFREARAVAALDHPNIVRAHDVDQDGNHHYLVMEYVDGTSLHDIVKRHGPMDCARAAHYVAQAACGLQRAHEAGWVHRDVKPGNILLDRQGVVKLLDLGLARFFLDHQTAITEKYDKDSVLGTADYLSPEQIDNSHTVDIRSDIYSLGATFYFLLTGQAPFEEGTATQKMFWHQTIEPEAIGKRRPEVPAAMTAVVERMMAKAPDRRYQVPIQVVEALSDWLQNPVAPPPVSEMPRTSPAVWSIIQASAGPVLPPSPLMYFQASQRTPGPGTMPRPSAAGDAPTEAIASGKSTTQANRRPNQARLRPGLWLGAAAAFLLGATALAAMAWFFFLRDPGGAMVLATAATTSSEPVPPDPIPPQPTPPGLPPEVVEPHLARLYHNKTCTVEMEVRSTYAPAGLVLLHSESDFTAKNNFTAVIALQSAGPQLKQMGIEKPEDYYKHKRVRVTGTVDWFEKRNQFQIRVTDAGQIKEIE